MSHRVWRAMAALAAVVVPCWTAEASVLRYRLTDLGPAPGNSTTIARFIDNEGRVLGAMSNPAYRAEDPATNTWWAFYWADGKLTELRDVDSEGFAMSPSGLVAARGPGGELRTYRPEGDGLALATTTPAMGYSAAVNDSGVVIGYDMNPDPRNYSIVWRHDTASGSTTYYQHGSEFQMDVRGINSDGDVIGQGAMDRMPIVYRDGVAEALPALPRGLHGEVTAINDAGQILLNASKPVFGPSEATFLLNDGEYLDMGNLGGGYVWGSAVNELGQVVGAATTSEGWPAGSRAFVTDGHEMVDLNDLMLDGDGWVLEQALDINDRGQIVGSGIFDGPAGVYRHAFLLDPEWVPEPLPVPEPGTLAIVGLGVAGWLVARRRRRQA